MVDEKDSRNFKSGVAVRNTVVTEVKIQVADVRIYLISGVSASVTTLNNGGMSWRM